MAPVAAFDDRPFAFAVAFAFAKATAGTFVVEIRPVPVVAAS